MGGVWKGHAMFGEMECGADCVRVEHGGDGKYIPTI